MIFQGNERHLEQGPLSSDNIMTPENTKTNFRLIRTCLTKNVKFSFFWNIQKSMYKLSLWESYFSIHFKHLLFKKTWRWKIVLLICLIMRIWRTICQVMSIFFSNFLTYTFYHHIWFLQRIIYGCLADKRPIQYQRLIPQNYVYIKIYCNKSKFARN